MLKLLRDSNFKNKKHFIKAYIILCFKGLTTALFLHFTRTIKQKSVNYKKPYCKTRDS